MMENKHDNLYLGKLITGLSLFLVIISTSIFKYRNLLINAEYNSIVFFTQLCVLLVSITSLLTRNWKIPIIISGVLFQSFLIIYWGNQVIYLSYIPIIVSILISITTVNHNIVRSYLIFSFILSLSEFSNMFPLSNTFIKNDDPNLFVMITLQGLSYLILDITINIFNRYSAVTNNTLDKIFLAHPISNFKLLLVKGIYTKMIIHFTNNLINSSIWAEYSKNEISSKVITLYNYDERKFDNGVTYTHVVETLVAYFNQSIKFKFSFESSTTNAHWNTCSNPQLLLIIVHDIMNNIIKYSSNQLADINITEQGKLTIISLNNCSNNKFTRKLNRNLRDIKDLLNLLNLGNLEYKKISATGRSTLLTFSS